MNGYTNTTSSRTTPRKKKKRLSRFGKVLLISWLILFIIGGTIGAAITGLCVSSKTHAQQEATVLPPYGTRDGREMVGEPSFDWGGDYDDEFVVLDCALSEDLQEFTFYLCKGYYIDYSFAMAVMFRESSYNVQAVSEDGRDHGLFQIRDVNNERLEAAIGVTDMYDPYQNIRAGLFMLRELFEKYDDPRKVLMAYNMGEYGASVLWEQGVFDTTFTRRVLTTADEYAAEIENNIKK